MYGLLAKNLMESKTSFTRQEAEVCLRGMGFPGYQLPAPDVAENCAQFGVDAKGELWSRDALTRFVRLQRRNETPYPK